MAPKILGSGFSVSELKILGQIFAKRRRESFKFRISSIFPRPKIFRPKFFPLQRRTAMSRVLQKQSVAQLGLLSLGMGLLPASLPPHRLKAATLCVVLLAGLITVSNLRQQSLSNVFLSSSKCLLPYSDSPPPSHGSTAKNSATGRVFKGHVIRKFVGPLCTCSRVPMPRVPHTYAPLKMNCDVASGGKGQFV